MSGGINNVTGCGSGVNGAHGSAISSGNASLSSSFLDFAGNGRYQAYNLARFSTASASSSSSSSSPSSSPQPQTTDVSTGTPVASSDAAGHSHAGRIHSNSALSDAQSPSSTAPSSSTASSTDAAGITSTAAVPSASAGSEHQDDKEDDWAINESYSGHGQHGITPSLSSSASTPCPDTSSNLTASSTPSSSTSRISSNGASDNTANTDEESQMSLQPSLTSFKSPSSIQASWRRTSESLPAVANSSGSSILSPTPSSKAGGLDLSSSTLVQQMLFGERPPHADSSESESGDWKQIAQEQEDGSQGEETSATIATLESTRASPSLTSMILNQSNVDRPSSSETNSTATESTDSIKVKKSLEEEDHISKLDIRVGIVRSVAAHPDAESLYIEQVDVGDKDGDESKEPRTIVSGLVRHVPKDYLEGRAVIVVGNMKPSKLRGVVSQGMLLCAMEQDSNGEVIKVGLLEPAEGSQPGDKVTFEGFTDEATVPVPLLTPKRKWFEKSRLHFSVKDGVAYYKGSPFRTVQGLVRCKSISEGQIS
ncbi:hypothetical protein EDD11_002513 [Mortierella claussenii]|nr:hypothetical protein EDD11_002513 [Mortierella claussenii]